MKKINFYDLSEVDELASPNEYINIDLDSSALKIFTDFKYTKPLTIENSLSAVEIEKLMQKAHVRMKFVIDEHNHFLGIVSLNELNQQNMIKKTDKSIKLSDLSIAEFMIPRSELKAIEYSDLKDLSIDDVMHALQDNGKQHCLVLESKRHRIRGIISASDIARKLKVPIDIQNRSTFIDIYKSIN